MLGKILCRLRGLTTQVRTGLTMVGAAFAALTALAIIGIGTVTPLAKLDVVGGIRIDGVGNGLTFADSSSVYNRASLIGPQGPMGPQGVQGPVGPQGPVDQTVPVVPGGTYILFGKIYVETKPQRSKPFSAN